MESYDLRAPALFLDPHPLFHRMRAEEPVHFSRALDAWVLTGYKDICAMLRDPRFSVMEEVKRIQALPAAEQSALEPLRSIFLSWAGRADEETHARFTKLLRRYFTPQYVASIRPRIQAHLDRLIASARERGGGHEMDVANGVAHPLSMTVVAELVGVPADPSSIDVYLACSEDVAAMLEMGDQHQLHRSQRGMLALCEKLAGTVAARRREPKEDLIRSSSEADGGRPFHGPQHPLAMHHVPRRRVSQQQTSSATGSPRSSSTPKSSKNSPRTSKSYRMPSRR